MLDFRSATFNRSLTETIAWCAEQGFGPDRRSWFRRQASKTKQWGQAPTLLTQLRESLGPLEYRLRSSALKPSFNMQEFSTDVPWAESVVEVSSKRSQLVGLTSSGGIAQDLAGGRLLLFVPSETLMDGAAQQSSSGFFDVNNVPPWDIWIVFSEQTLVSWVPPLLIGVAQIGIDANPEACIRWAD